MQKIADFVQQLLIENYDLGEVKQVTDIKAGDTNKSFLAFCRKDGVEKIWYVRQYNAAAEERDIIYEHAFEGYFNNNVNGEIQTLIPVSGKHEKTCVHAECDGQFNYYAVFNTVQGLEPYSWEYNDLPDAAIDSCARIVAKFQAWGYGFEGPEGSGRREPPLEEQFQIWKKDLPYYLREKRKDKRFKRFTDYFEGEVEFLLETIDFCENELKQYKSGLQKCINHKDLNPGNVMFDENDKICAVFDMDWINEDYRLYDIAWMGYQAIASWDVHTWGEVPIQKVGRFISIYNKIMEERNCPMGILSKEEVQFLPTMMIIGAVKVITDFTCYEDHSEEVHRMFVNTWRFVCSVHFMMDHIEEMRAAVTR